MHKQTFMSVSNLQADVIKIIKICCLKTRCLKIHSRCILTYILNLTQSQNINVMCAVHESK